MSLKTLTVSALLVFKISSDPTRDISQKQRVLCNSVKYIKNYYILQYFWLMETIQTICFKVTTNTMFRVLLDISQNRNA